MAVLPGSGTRRCYFWLALIYLLLAIYGSFVPFHYHALPWAEVVAEWRDVELFPLTISSRTDFAANVLLFVPLAFFWMAAFCADRPALLGWLLAVILIPALAALSAAIEFTQIYFPPRVPTGSDIVGEATGGILGVLCWLVAGQAITDWARRLSGAWGSRELPALLLPAYLVGLLIIHVLPLDLTLSPAAIYHKYRDGMIILNPFRPPDDNVFEAIEKYLWKLAYFIPVGCMLAYLPVMSWQDGRNWRRALVAGLALVAFTEFLKLFVMSRYFSTGHILTGTLGVLAGWCAIRALRTGHAGFLPTSVWLAGLFVLWLAFVTLTTWRPFTFSLEPEFVEAQWRTVSFIPFADYHRGKDYDAFDQFFHKVLLYVPLGIFLSGAAILSERKGAGVLVTALGLAVAAFFEIGQLFLPGRYASITDILVETFGVWLGFRIACYVHTRAAAGSTQEEARLHAQGRVLSWPK